MVNLERWRSLVTVIGVGVAVTILAGTWFFAPRDERWSAPSCPEGTPSGPPVRPPHAFLEEVQRHPDYAGAYVLPDCFALVVLTVGDTAVFNDLAERYFIPNERLIVGRATYTHNELYELAEQIVEDREKWLAVGIDIQSAGVKMEVNRTIVGILELTDDARDQLIARYGARIVVEQSGPFHELSETD